MKTIVLKHNNLSQFIIDDSTKVIISDKNIVFDNVVVIDLNSTNAKVIENVITPPTDWVGGKYYYIEAIEDKPLLFAGWKLNPNWRETEIIQ